MKFYKHFLIFSILSISAIDQAAAKLRATEEAQRSDFDVARVAARDHRVLKSAVASKGVLLRNKNGKAVAQCQFDLAENPSAAPRFVEISSHQSKLAPIGLPKCGRKQLDGVTALASHSSMPDYAFLSAPVLLGVTCFTSAGLGAYGTLTHGIFAGETMAELVGVAGYIGGGWAGAALTLSCGKAGAWVVYYLEKNLK